MTAVRRFSGALSMLALLASSGLGGCGDATRDAAADDPAGASSRPVEAPLPEEPSPPFRNVEEPTAYVGDAACTECHAEAATAYAEHGMARSFHPWTPDTRVEEVLSSPLRQGPSGFDYAVVEEDGALYQVETLTGPGGRPLHELRHRMDWVMGSGIVARTYFTEENGRLFQLPLTWYAEGGWDFSPGYEVNNARFGRLMPDRCIACHGSYPEPIPHLEGKYAAISSGIGCERCHGPGALHVEEREAEARAGGEARVGGAAGEVGVGAEGGEADAPSAEGYDDSIVNPARLPFERRLDVREQCHVHTAVTVLREGRGAFDYEPSEPLREHIGIFKPAGSIDIVSHADRLRQSACFIATRPTDDPLECATCHDPHGPADAGVRNAPCAGCHRPEGLLERVASSAAADHTPDADCVSCHMPRVQERTVPHGSFTEHWIRVIDDESSEPAAAPAGEGPVAPYFEVDREGPESAVYQGLGQIVYATLATDAAALGTGADALARALATDTSRADAAFVLGLAYRQLGRNDEAIEALERSLAIEPDRPQGLHALAQAFEAVGRDADTIRALYERALGIQPALAFVRADYADFLAGGGLYEEAEALYRAALEERPGLAVAAFNLGALAASDGRLEEAEAWFAEAVRREPAFAEALSPLFQIQTSRTVVGGVRAMGSPIERLPVRDRGPAAARLTIASSRPAVLAIVNVPPGASVRILEPGGALVRALPGDGSPNVGWDLKNAGGLPVPPGLYQVDVRGSEGSPPQAFYTGIVHISRR